MKLPDKDRIIEIIKGEGYSSTYLSSNHSFHDTDIVRAADKILECIKVAQFDENPEQVDPNLVKIAELEAKIKVYETVIDGAGIKLAIRDKKSEIGFKMEDKNERRKF